MGGRTVKCDLCDMEMAAGSLRSHLETQHDTYRHFVLGGGEEESEGRTYEARRELATGRWPCPVPECPGGGRDPYDLRRHFRSRHPRDLVSVRGETFPRCEACGMQVSAEVLGSKQHEATRTCQTFSAMRVQHGHALAGAKAMRRRFMAYGTEELRQVEGFKYLGRIVSHVDNDVPAMRRNLKRARGIWRRLSKVLATEEIPAPVAGMFYQAVVAAVLLYGSESWSLPPRAMKVLEGFHVEAARRLTGMMPEKRGETWTYPKSKEVLAAAHLKTIGEYVTVRRQRAAALVVRRPVMAACRETEAMRGTPPRKYWWDQAIDWDLA